MDFVLSFATLSTFLGLFYAAKALNTGYTPGSRTINKRSMIFYMLIATVLWGIWGTWL